MKQLIVFSMIVLTTLATTPSSSAQDAEQLRLMELQARIEKLQLEIEALQIQRESLSFNAGPAARPAEVFPNENPALQLAPPEPIQLQESPYLAPPQRRPVYRGVYAEPEVVPVFVPQPVVAPVFAEPCPYGGFGGGFGSGGLYIGPGGWGFDVGGLQFNFARGYGHGHGHHHKHHRHHRHDDD